MSKNREIEAKTILAKKSYEQMCQSFPVKKDFIQTNNYFDTPEWTLKQHQIGLRIRIYADHAEQTMKVPDLHPVQDNFHEVIEINDDLPVATAESLVKKAKAGRIFKFTGNVGNYLNQHFQTEQQNLQLFTWSKTRRILANGPENCELTLDQTEYPDGYIDYELEIENTDPALIKKVQLQLEQEFSFTQNADNTNQNKIARATAHRRKR